MTDTGTAVPVTLAPDDPPGSSKQPGGWRGGWQGGCLRFSTMAVCVFARRGTRAPAEPQTPEAFANEATC